jgi:hypothetical protein
MLNSIYMGLAIGCVVMIFYRGNIMARFGAGCLATIIVFGAGYLLGVG